MSEGFRKGKLPERFEGLTDEQLMNLPLNIYDKMIEAVQTDTAYKVNCYFDTDLTAIHIIKKIEQLEKALDKACAKIAWLSDDYETIESTWDFEDWKEWALSDAD